ncbi:MAG: pseudaminic acid synthase [Thermoplasmata archaeon]|nr:MAG: pseudaminic acid synthase [Thermoplasmata archaeon]
MNEEITLGSKKTGLNHPVYIVAEMSANHNQDFQQAIKIIEAAVAAGADAIKLQTYTPDTITIDCNNEYFKIKGTIWEGKNLYELYGEAYTPWEWQPKLREIAKKLGMDLFSTPFDHTAVDFLEKMDVPAYKVASLELVDLHLIRKIAKTGKPIIMSTGMATLAEIDEAVQAIRNAGGKQLALLKCNSAYPAPPEEMNLQTIPHLAEAFGVPVGLSDHTLGIAVPAASVALGACIIEKHLTLSRDIPGPDSAFSLEPREFKAMVEAVRIVEKALGQVSYDVSEREIVSRAFRRSLFVVQDIEVGARFTSDNIRSVRPSYGLHPRYLDTVIGRYASRDIKRGTPLDWSMVVDREP